MSLEILETAEVLAKIGGTINEALIEGASFRYCEKLNQLHELAKTVDGSGNIFIEVMYHSTPNGDLVWNIKLYGRTIYQIGYVTYHLALLVMEPNNYDTYHFGDRWNEIRSSTEHIASGVRDAMMEQVSSYLFDNGWCEAALEIDDNFFSDKLKNPNTPKIASEGVDSDV